MFTAGISDLFFTECGANGESIAGCNVHELVHSAEGRGVLGSGERGADAKSIDLGSSGKQIGDLFAWEIPFAWHYAEFSGVTICKGRSNADDPFGDIVTGAFTPVLTDFT